MPSARSILLAGGDFNIQTASILAQCCQAAYLAGNDPSGTIVRLRDEIGATFVSAFFPPQLNSQAIVFGYQPQGYVVAFAGITSFRQFIAYFTQGGLGPSPLRNPSAPRPMQQSSYLSQLYGANTLIDSMKHAMGDLALLPGNTTIPVTIAGHSQGGGLATLLAADLAQNAPNVRVQGVYLFGSPHVYNDTAARTYNGLNVPTFNLCNGADIVPYWPGSLSTTYRLFNTLTNLPFNPTNNAWVDQGYYNTHGTPMQLDQFGIARCPAFGTASIAQVRRMFEVLREGDNAPILLDHDIYSYAVRLAKRAQSMAPPGSQERRVQQAVANLPLPSPTQNQDLPSTALPPLAAFTPPAAPPAGAAYSPPRGFFFSRGIPAFGGGARPSGVRGTRAAIGDGHAKMATRRLLEMMEYLDGHDTNVASGGQRGTQYIHDPGRISRNQEDAWYVVKEYVRDRVADGQ